MSKPQKVKRKTQKRSKPKIKMENVIFSISFIATIAISFIMLCICAANDTPTRMATVISGCAWLLFDILYAYAIKNKWSVLFDECSTSRLSCDFDKTEEQQKKDNWEGNCLKFAISVIIFFVHVAVLIWLSCAT